MTDAGQTVDRSKDTAGSGADGQHEQGSAPGRPGAPGPGQPAGRSDGAREPSGGGEQTPAGDAAGSPQAAGGGDRATQQAGADEGALQQDVDELVAVAAQRDEYLALAQRTQADFENYRKRVAKESAAAQERGMARLAQELLPALDNLDRAFESAAQREGEEAPLLEGVRLVRSELQAALARVGIECFSPKGEPFDPAEHEAMAQKPVPEAPSGTVVEVLQPGYRLGKAIIRPARVFVAA
jgi:molecular chaperone GrpE